MLNFRKTAACLACMVAGLTMAKAQQTEPQWIALEPVDTVVVPHLHGGVGLPRKICMYRMPQFRRDITIDRKVRKASAQVCGLGHFELMVNGSKVGDHFLDPGWTCYDKEALYVDFDLTKLLRKGENQIDVMLGNGFFNVPNERYIKVSGSYGQPKLWMRLEIEYSNGETECIVSDCENWKVSESPITFSSIYGGESYDARRESQLEWQTPVEAPESIRLIPQNGTELIVREEIPAKRHMLDPDGRWIFDLGQNASGIVRITVKGESGQEVQMWPAELLDKEGRITQDHSGSPYHWDYTLKGGEAETWQPRFTYYGQRYIMVAGAVPAGEDNPQGLPVISELTGLHTCTASAEVGRFECGDTLFNQIHKLIDWAIRSNSASVFTDCPHREKLGWMEQDYLMQYSIQYRYNVKDLYAKIFNDMEASQWENGCIPTIAPMYVMFEGGFEDTPEWGSAFIICPWYAYKWYGDESLVTEHYPAMKRYIDYLGTRADNHIIAYGLGDWFDIGPGPLGNSQLTSNGVSATCIYYYDVKLMVSMARLTGNEEDAVAYEKLAEEIRQSFNEKYYNAEKGCYDRGSQTAQAMPLYFGMVDESERGKVLQSLIDDIEGRGYALTAGDIGYRFVLQALQEAGRSDVIYKMNSNTDVPGYGWQLKHGATALTESWQAYESVSNNHLMLGHLMEWLYAGLCGIRQSEESIGWKHIKIAPCIIPEIGHAEASLETPQGLASVSWKLRNGKLIIKGRIPAGSDACISVPEYGIEASVGKGRFRVKGRRK